MSMIQEVCPAGWFTYNCFFLQSEVMKSSLDHQKARSRATQMSLMEAAEKLISRKGIQNVSNKEIVKEAGQKNGSALQYHFKNLQGLIDDIQVHRDQQTHEKRSELLAKLLSAKPTPSLRDLCRIMVMPTFLLAQANAKYRRYVISFSHELALVQDSALTRVSRYGGGGESGQRTGELLRAVLPHLNESAWRQRMDIAVRMCSISMGNHARQTNAFRGPKAELFVSNLIDALEGVLSAPVSNETTSIARSITPQSTNDGKKRSGQSV